MSQHPSDPRPDSALGTHTPERDALSGLDDLDELPVAEHVARFEAVHDALRARLAGEPGGKPRSDGGRA
ncbi:hypothetical protein Xcel_1339 [Xylanimonas cellulosilytica DSM 15894]|uniref:Uncharacterized protein n=1 Tax=Xylanimonas cellulosilytica (strain DSM 15894 / JCM 12276 / CECT 5975 / KCTC 9989 / LMG 20990 / NBRC 107835 / XIL07) TaxID=446471 RepID=D1BRB5_XYLCX|nr:hypothetical protein [Xylanimonas cellulosilytica]ACZ30370.1 hypothetical protein Xcel_1339 [Xylanimonas cellulosilytica DSM 15894]